MHKNKKNEELQSRREFFKKAAKGALPIMGFVLLASNPMVSNASETTMGCRIGCSGGCSGSCSGSCLGGCRGACQGSCKFGCDGTCKGGCTSSCGYTCKGGSYGT